MSGIKPKIFLYAKKQEHRAHEEKNEAMKTKLN